MISFVKMGLLLKKERLQFLMLRRGYNSGEPRCNQLREAHESLFEQMLILARILALAALIFQREEGHCTSEVSQGWIS